MAGRWRWRAAVLATMAVALGGMPLRALASGGDGGEHGNERGGERGGRGGATVVDRLNPDLDGDRIVFTQVEQRRGTTSRSIWSRDLASGRETLVAEVGTGEPFPAASGPWTAWSETNATQHLVRARSLAERRVVDVFSTDFNALEQIQAPTLELLSVDLSGTTVAVANGSVPALSGGDAELVRVSLPSGQRSFVDVTSTTEPIPVRVAQSGATTVVSLSSAALFSIVDGAGNVVAAPTNGDCAPFFGGARLQPAIDGPVIAAATMCLSPAVGGFVPAIVSCTLPCDEVTTTFLPPNGGLPAWVSVSGTRVAWSVQDGGGPTSTFGIYLLDLTNGGPPVLVHRTSGGAGPKVSLSGDRLAWDQAVIADGEVRRAVYVRDLAAGVTTVIEPGVRQPRVVPAATGPIRINPDVRDRKIAYTELARDGSAAGVWTRSLSGSPSLVSSVATDGTTPRLGDGWLAWNTLDPGAAVERVVATSGPGAPLVDVYATDLAPFDQFAFSPAFPARAAVDVGGSKAVVSAYTVDSDQTVVFFPRLAVFGKDLPNGPLQYLAPVIGSPTSPFSNANLGRTNGTYTAAAEYAYPVLAIDLFDAAGALRQVPIPSTSPYGPSCNPTALDVSSTRLVVAVSCFGGTDNGAALLSCTLPCANGLVDRVAVPNVVNDVAPGIPQPPYLRSLRVDGNDAVVSYTVVRIVGQSFVEATVIDRYDLRRRSGPVRVSTALGTVGAPQVSAGTITWSVDGWDGDRSGTVYVYDIGRGRTSAV